MAVQPLTTAEVRISSSGTQQVTLAGRLDVHSAADVRLMLLDVIAGGAGDLLLHLGGAEIGDATGVGVLVECHHRARRHGRRLVLCEATARTERLLRLARLHRILHRGSTEASVSAVTA